MWMNNEHPSLALQANKRFKWHFVVAKVLETHLNTQHAIQSQTCVLYGRRRPSPLLALSSSLYAGVVVPLMLLVMVLLHVT